MMKVLLILAIAITVYSQETINKVTIRGGLDSVFGCWLTLRNSEQLLDIRTNCMIGNATDRTRFSQLVELIPVKKAYYFKNQVDGEIRGYRYVKDPLNYYFKLYNFEIYNQVLK